MVKFKIGSVYRVIVHGAVMPVKVTRITASRKTMWFSSSQGEKKRSKINIRDSCEVAKYDKHQFNALTFHHKEIMRLVFFFSVKLVVLARRAKQRKERMYAVAWEHFIAEEQNFDRVAKAVYENMLEV